MPLTRDSEYLSPRLEMFLMLILWIIKCCHCPSFTINLLIHVDLSAAINAFKFIIFNPPSQYVFIITSYFIFDGPCHKNSKNKLFICLIICSLGLGSERKRLLRIGKSNVFITVIFPKGVRHLRFHAFIELVIFNILSL